MNGIHHGVDIEYIGERRMNRAGKNQGSALTAKAKPLVAALIDAGVKAGKLAGPFDTRPFKWMSVSPLGTVPKGDNDIRLIHNLSYPYGGDSVNANVAVASFNLSRFDDAADIIARLGPGCTLCKLDVHAAYKQIHIRSSDYHLTGFMWDGKYYYDRTLPFGLRSSCRKWDVFASALHYFMVTHGGIPFVEHYIDDFIIITPVHNGGGEPPAAGHLRTALAMCESLGMPMAPKKTEGPVTCLTYLGIELDTIAMEARLAPKRIGELKSLLHTWGEKTDATILELQSLIGILSFAAQVVRPGRTFLRRIIDFTVEAGAARRTDPARSRWTPSPRIALTQSIRDDVRWWTDFIDEFNGTTLLYEVEWTTNEQLELHTDACMVGYGAKFGDHWLQGRWTESQKADAIVTTRESMPYFELYALTIAAVTWGHMWRGRRIRFHCDCMPMVQALHVERRTSSRPNVMHLIRILTATAARHQFDFRVDHIVGETNIAADALSRYNMIVFDSLRLAQPTIDLSSTDHAPLPPPPSRPNDSHASR